MINLELFQSENQTQFDDVTEVCFWLVYLRFIHIKNASHIQVIFVIQQLSWQVLVSKTS